jgi:hypothetical protein
MVYLRVHPAARVVARRWLDPLSVVGCPVEGVIFVGLGNGLCDGSGQVY